MKFLFEVISVSLCIHVVVPVSMYYIYDEDSNFGYYANNGGVGDYSKPKLSGHKKYLTSNNNQKNSKLVNERVVDAHFSILNPAPKSVVANENIYTPKVVSSEERWQEKPVETEQKMQDNIQDYQGQSQPKTPPTSKTDYKSLNQDFYKTNQREYLVNHDNQRLAYEKQRKTDVSAYQSHHSPESQKKINRNNNKQTNSQNYRQKGVGSGVKDTIVHKTNLNIDRNTQIMTRTLDQIAQKMMDRTKPKQGENRKRDAEDNPTTKAPDTIHKHNVNPISDNMKKYIRKDVTAANNMRELGGSKMPTRIGNYDTEVEERSKPYALFYKMSHENIEPEDFFASKDEGTVMEEHGNSFYNDKERVMLSIETEINERNARNIESIKQNQHAKYKAFQNR